SFAMSAIGRAALLERRAFPPQPFCSRLEKTVGRVLRGALPGHGGLQPLDLRGQKRDPFGALLDRQQGKILSDLVADLFPRLVIVLARHAASSLLVGTVASRHAAG